MDQGDADWTPTGDGSWGSNMDSMPRWWSDLQVHFYPQAPHRRHGCWTMLLLEISTSASMLEDRPGDAKTDSAMTYRERIGAFCHGQKKILAALVAPGARTAVAVTALLDEMSAYNLMWVDPKRRGFIKVPESVRVGQSSAPADPDAILKLDAIVWSEKQRAKGYVNVWDYIMFAQTWAFDWEQQQAVLNAYYGEVKQFDRMDPNTLAVTASTEAAFDPADPRDCNAYRPSRPSDPTDGTHCLPSKTMLQPLLSANR